MPLLVKVVIVGFSDIETNKIEKTLCCNSSQAVSYITHREGENANFNIVIADADNSAALNRAEKLSTSANNPLLVLVGSQPEPSAGRCVISKPIIGIRLLGRLNTWVASEDVLNRADNRQTANDARFVPETSNEVIDVIQDTALTREWRVLVVDDSPAMLKALEQELQQVQRSITRVFASSGEQALQFICQQPYFDLILLDVMMPGIDGYETCKIIRKDPRYKQTTIIMLSAKTSKLDEMRGIMAGCTTYMTKPVVHDNLQTLLHKVLS